MTILCVEEERNDECERVGNPNARRFCFNRLNTAHQLLSKVWFDNSTRIHVALKRIVNIFKADLRMNAKACNQLKEELFGIIPLVHEIVFSQVEQLSSHDKYG